MLKAPLKKNLLICAIIFACCGSQNSDIEIDLSNTSTPKSIPTSSTTVLVNKEYAKDLEVGDCFEFSNRELDYVAYEEQILLIDCNELHTNEVITIINFLSDEETVFNDDNIPNKELYDSCMQSYFDKYDRPLAGTLTYINWIGDTSDFETKSKLKYFL